MNKNDNNILKASRLDLTNKSKEDIKALYSLYFNELEVLTDRVREETNFEGSLIALTAIREKVEYAEDIRNVEVLTEQHLNGFHTDLKDLVKNSNVYELFKELIMNYIQDKKQEEKE